MSYPAVLAIYIVLFAFVHSLTASLWFKKQVERAFGRRFSRVYYRLLYTILSLTTTSGLVILYLYLPYDYIFKPGMAIAWPFHLIQFIGLIIITLSYKSVSNLEFLGIKQILRGVKDDEIFTDVDGYQNKEFITGGIYSFIRHPIYLGSIMVILFEPFVTVKGLVLRLLLTFYYIVGSLLEERRLIEDFGEEYIRYREKVPMLLPGLSYKTVTKEL